MTLSYHAMREKDKPKSREKAGIPRTVRFPSVQIDPFSPRVGDQKSRRPIRLVITQRKKWMTGSRAPRYNSPMMTKKP